MSATWYRSPIDRQALRELSQKSDFRAHIHLFGHLGLCLLSGAICYYLMNSSLWYLLPLGLFIHGSFFSFLGWAGASHELVHNTVFKTKSLNNFYLKFLSLLTWNNPILFARSHAHHHRFTMLDEKDGEVNPSAKISFSMWLGSLTFNWPSLKRRIRAHYMNSIGVITGDWPIKLFPEEDRAGRRSLINWSRQLLLFQALTAALFITIGHWELIILFNLAPFFGNFLPTLLADAQHHGMKKNTKDFRESCRSVELSRFLVFLYWGMNFHLEHHMYPQIPFYNLVKLRKVLKDDLPEAQKGIIPLFKELYPDSLSRRLFAPKIKN